MSTDEFELVDLGTEYAAGRLRPRLYGGGGELELVDLGTEYAVWVGQDGGGEVHVLSGKVDIRRVKGESLRVVVESGTAVGITPQGVVKPAAFCDQFVGVERLKALRSTSEAAGLRRWREHSRRWSQDTTLAMYFTFDGQNGFDRQLTGRVLDRPAAGDGAIVECRWVSGRFEGKGALEFMGTGDRVKVRVGGDFASLSLFVSLRVGGGATVATVLCCWPKDTRAGRSTGS